MGVTPLPANWVVSDDVADDYGKQAGRSAGERLLYDNGHQWERSAWWQYRAGASHAASSRILWNHEPVHVGYGTYRPRCLRHCSPSVVVILFMCRNAPPALPLPFHLFPSPSLHPIVSCPPSPPHIYLSLPSLPITPPDPFPPDPSSPDPSLSSFLLPSGPPTTPPLEVGPLNPARGSGEHSPSVVWDRAPGQASGNRIWCILALKSDIWWKQFKWFSGEPVGHFVRRVIYMY